MLQKFKLKLTQYALKPLLLEKEKTQQKTVLMKNMEIW